MAERIYKPKLGEAKTDLAVKKRFWELDFLRGLCVLLMVFDHFFFSAGELLEYVVWPWSTEFWRGLAEFAQIYWVNQTRVIIRYFVIALFLLLCGISCTLSHNNLLRGIKTLAFGMVITMATWLADSFLNTGVVIVFGVIHMLGVAMLLFSLFDFIGWLLQTLIETKKTKGLALWVRKMLPAVAGIIGLIVFFALPLAHFEKISGTVTVDGERVEFFYTELMSDVTAAGGFKDTIIHLFTEVTPSPFYSSDYFPVMPYAFLVLIGSGIGRLVYNTKAKYYLSPLDGKWNKPINFVGRHALLFYLLHQLVIVAFFFAMGGFYYIISR